MSLREGVPTWHQRAPEERWQTACLRLHPEAQPIAIFGSSIFHGTNLAASETFSAHLQRMLDAELGPGRLCVMNFAQPGYSAQGSLAEARSWLPRLERPLVLWQVWDSDRAEYTLIGGRAYALQDLAVDAAGYPDAFSFLPRRLTIGSSSTRGPSSTLRSRSRPSGQIPGSRPSPANAD